MLKHVYSRIKEHISSQLDYFRIHTSHLATQELGVKNDIVKGKEDLKVARLSESLLIFLEIQIVWNNGGQKHSVSIDVRCPVPGQFFLCSAESMN